MLEYVKEQKLGEALGDPSGYSVGTKRASKYAHLELRVLANKASGRNFNVSLSPLQK